MRRCNRRRAARHSGRRGLLLVLILLVGLSPAAAAGAAGAQQDARSASAAGASTVAAASLGLVESTACGGLQALLDDAGEVLLCTHGHDEPPAAADAPVGSAAAGGASAPCVGDGRSGMRVQVVYARADGTQDRYDALRGQLRETAGVMSHGLHASARGAGGGRHIRYVTDGRCEVSIQRVTVSPDAAASFAGVASDLRRQGFTDSRRKYLVFLDHVGYCGFGSLPQDRSPGIGNAANGRAGTFGLALVGSVCFRTVHAGAHTGMHELLHTLGAVADHAPNSTGRGHCTDGSDVMCYADESGRATRSVCPAVQPFRIDCANEDYFHPAPPAGHRLSTTWNTADSAFLEGSRFADWRDPVAPEADAAPHDGGVTVTWQAAGRYTRRVEVLRDGRLAAELDASARSFDDTAARAGVTHRYAVRVLDELGYTATSATVEATRPAGGSLLDAVIDLVPGAAVPPLAEPVVEVVPSAQQTTTARRSGADRYATAAAISRAAFPAGVARVYVASGADFPDALGAGAAAASIGGPVLLTAPGSLPEASAKELVRLRPAEVVVVGGARAVTDLVLRQVREATGAPTRRVAGSDRFATAASVAADAFTATGGTVYVATGAAYPDALSGAAAAAREGAPLLLVSRDEVPAATSTALRALQPDRIVVLGGAAAVGEATVAALRRSAADVVRVAGPDRFATAAAVAERAFPDAAGTVLVASGAGFADALAGGPAAARAQAPLLLVDRDALPQATAAALRRLGPGALVVLGGEAAVSARTERAAADASR
jgi:putative cell wall-binding protein